MLLAALDMPVVVVVMNNSGGDIFSLLPIATQTTVLDRFFRTPQHVSIQSAADMAHLPYACVDEAVSFSSAFQRCLGEAKSSVLEVKTTGSAAHYQQIMDQVSVYQRREFYVSV